jgi:aspartate/methionine/tyrosine aminotransferase
MAQPNRLDETRALDSRPVASLRQQPTAPGRYPDRDLELATHLSRWHAAAPHHLSASECETMRLAELLALADPEDAARWDRLALGYTDPAGADWLRAAIAAGYTAATRHDLLCFAGAQEALYATLHAVLSPGDHAIVVLPSYQSMETLCLGLCAVSGVALDHATDWSLDIDAVAAAIRHNTRVVVISFPNNPTGKQLERERFDALVALCRRHGIWLLSDEVYRLTERDPAHRLPCAADAYERGISLGATSKSYGLPGLRVGWVACRNRGLMRRLATMRQYLSTCGAGTSEVLACIALKAAPVILARNRAITEANLALLLAFFARHDTLFSCRPPDGGMVCYPQFNGPGGVERFATRMAEVAGVLLLPSSVFRSDLRALPADRFRIGFGQRSFVAGLAALERALP